MEPITFIYGWYALAVPPLAFIIYVWRRKNSVAKWPRLGLCSALAVLITMALAMWYPVETPMGAISFVDVGVMAVAMTFGPEIGGLAGAFGPALGLFITGGGPVAVLVLTKGIEGIVTGYVSEKSEGPSGRILGGVLGGSMAIAITLVLAYTAGIGDPDAVLSTGLVEVSTGIILGTAISGLVKRKVQWTEEVI